MWEKTKSLPIKLRTVVYFAILLTLLAGVTPVLADYLGPDRTVTQTVGSCKVVLATCKYVAAKKTWKYKNGSSWSCSNESKPWLAYPSNSVSCSPANSGYTYWRRVDNTQEQIITYPSATIDNSLEDCSLTNGWCTSAELFLSAEEPVAGYEITAIEGTLNGQNFTCPDSDCGVPLIEGQNALTYWALSSWGDSSTMGSLTVKIDSQIPVISGAFNGTTGSNGWYVGPVSFNGSAADATSGLASFTCTLDGTTLGSCNSISVNDEGSHTLVLTALDNAGNQNLIAQDIPIDTQPPALNSSLQGILGSNDWYIDAELHASASDPVPGSTLSALEYNIDGTSWVVFPSTGILDLPEGKHAVDIRATDHAGHTVSAAKSFWLDSVAPGVILDPQATMGTNDWYITSLHLAAAASDDTSGLDKFEYTHNGSGWITYTAPLVLTDGSHKISFWAQDQAGLVTQVDRIYQVDTVRPQIAGSISGTPGTNGWYVSNVTLSASAADPLPGSGVDAFTYILNSSTETPYVNALTIPDGTHTLRLNVQDKAGLTYFTEQSIKVDTIRPSLTIQTSLPNWVKEKVSLTGSSEDTGSGLSKVEISTNGGQTWQTVNGTTSWSHEWDTTKDSNGLHNVIVRAVDQAGLTTEQTIPTAIDNQNPTIVLPKSWLQWQTVTLDIWDDESGLSEARIEISDPDGRWKKRTITLDSAQFPLSFKWDRRFGDDTIAPNGIYDVTVTAIDQLGNVSKHSAEVRILIDILPAGPTATPQPYSRMMPTPLVSLTPAPISLPAVTSTPVVSVFGEIQPTLEVTTAPEISPIPRATPTQTSILEWLESVLIPDTNSKDEITELDTFGVQASSSDLPGADSNILWGAAAAALVGSVTSYALEEKRKKLTPTHTPDEHGRQHPKAIGVSIPEQWIPQGPPPTPEKQKPKDPKAMEAALAERRAKSKARKMKKLETKWAQEKAWEQARQQEEFNEKYGQAIGWAAARQQANEAARPKQDFATKGTSAKIDRAEENDAVSVAAPKTPIVQKTAEQTQRAEQLQDRVENYQVARKQAEDSAAKSKIAESTTKSWWQKSIDWIDQHQTEIAIGLGVAAGVAAIVLSGGVATPLVAAAWMAGAAAVAGTTVALGTIALNAHYERDWNENLLRNVLTAGIVATAVSGAGFLYQAVAGGAATFCTFNPNLCTQVQPILKFIDSVEELSLSTQLGYQTLTHDPGAADTALELHMELIDGGVPGNSIANELSKETVEAIGKYGDEAIELVKLYGDDAVQIILKYGDEGIALLQKYGDDITSSTAKYGYDAVELFVQYEDETVDFMKRAEKLEVNPTNILSDPLLPGQSLEGWLLDITDPRNPVNKPDTLKLSEKKVEYLLQESLVRPESDEFVIGYFDANRVDGYEEIADERNATKLSMPQPLYRETGFQENTGDFWPINRAAIQYGIDKRKTFVLSTDLDTILSNPEKYTYAEIQMILHPSSGYTHIYKDGYDMLVPIELLQP